MDKRFRANATMHGTVTRLLDEYPDVVAADPDLAAAEGLRQPVLGRMRVAARAAGEDTRPNTGSKETQKAAVLAEAVRVLGRVGAYAHRTPGQGELAARVDFSVTDLDRMPEEELVGRLEALMAVVRGVVTQIATLPATRLDALDDAIDALAPRLGSPRNAVVNRAAAHALAERELAAATEILARQHDALVRDFQHAAPATPAEERQQALFERWAGARNVVAPPSPGAPEAVVTGGSSGAPTGSH